MLGSTPGPRARPVFETLRSRILSGEYAPGQRLPSQEALAASFGVAALTMRQAIAFLQREELVSCEQGRGTFVRAPSGVPSPAEIAVAAPVAILAVDLHGLVTFWNQAMERLTGWSASEALGRPIPGVPSERMTLLQELHARVMAGESLFGIEFRRLRKDGSYIDVSMAAAPTRDAAGKIIGSTAVLIDITVRRHTESALREAEKRFRATFDRAAVGIAHTGLDGSWLLVNQRLCDLYGRTREELMQLRFQDITHPDDLEADLNELNRLLAGEIPSYSLRKRYLRKDGSTMWGNLTVSAVSDDEGRPEYVIAIIEDIDDRVRAEEQIAHRALHDPLTDLPNRTLLSDRLDTAIRMGERQLRPISLLLMDLDHFKDINDTYGHQYGDEILQQLGTRLAPLLRRSDTIGRLGGDEFAVILPGTDAEGARQTATRLLQALDEPFLIAGQRFEIGASVGAAIFPRHGSDAGTLLRRADVAMYVAKRRQSGYALYTSSSDQYSLDRLSLVGGLRQAIEADELFVQYQPKVYMADGDIEGVEALLRWRHPERGLIMPDQFIPLAEHTGFIKPLTLWLLDHVLQQCRAWERAGLRLDVAINLSPRSLLDRELIDALLSAPGRFGLAPARLQVELTESAFMDDRQGANEALRHLHQAGMKIAIDDFGTGYSSLAHLKRLPIDQIKIDRSFVQELLAGPCDCSIVQAIINLGHELRMQVLAEGVENQEVWDLLTGLHCDAVQGYHISRPLGAVDLERWARSRGVSQLVS